jgi:hypothetical protein
VELTVDPWSERLAAERLTKAGQRLEGYLPAGHWAKPMQELGVRSAAATLLAGGRRLRVRLIVDAERANLVFWRLPKQRRYAVERRLEFRDLRQPAW